MRSRYSLVLPFTCAIALVCATPLFAQNAQQKTDSKPATTQQSASANSSDKHAQHTVDGPYRLTYTLIELNGNKTVGMQHYTVLLDADRQRTHTSLQSRIPVPTGASSYRTIPTGIQTDSRLSRFQNGIELAWGVMQTSLPYSKEEKKQSTTDQLPPVTRDYNLYGRALLQENQPTVLAKSDIPGSTHQLEVQAELTRVR